MTSIDLALVGDLAPLEVLYDFDGPCIFTSRTSQNALVLVYLSDELEDEKLLRFLVSSTSDQAIEALKTGTMSVREAIEQAPLWIVDVDWERRPVRGMTYSFEALSGHLPALNAKLWAHLEDTNDT